MHVSSTKIVVTIKSINTYIYIYIYKQTPHMGKHEILPCGAFYEVFFIQASKSTKFAFISKY